jgi:hypothetical protein
MHPARRRGKLLGLILMLVGLWGLGASRGEEPGRLGRLFRFGGVGRVSTARPAPPEPRTPTYPAALPESNPNPSSGPRLVPQPRVSRPLTQADPILTRVALGRSDNGKPFGMFLQVFADGTVIDTEGVHHLGPDGLRPLLQALQAGDFSRPRGHCGGPATDFVEQVQLIVYDRALGRLRATPFSHSGSLQGCDPALQKLQAAIESIQAQLGAPIPSAPPSPSSNAKPLTLTTP